MQTQAQQRMAKEGQSATTTEENRRKQQPERKTDDPTALVLTLLIPLVLALMLAIAGSGIVHGSNLSLVARRKQERNAQKPEPH